MLRRSRNRRRSRRRNLHRHHDALGHGNLARHLASLGSHDAHRYLDRDTLTGYCG